MAEYDFYFVDNNPRIDSGDHEVHKEGCSWLALAKRKTYLGHYDNCEEALAKARTIYERVSICTYCCKECHQTD